MSEEQPAGSPDDGPTPRAGQARRGRRRARPPRRHTVARVLVVTGLALAMVTALATVWLYRDLNGNLTVTDVTGQLTDRPDEVDVEGPQEPVNILVMGSDDRDGEGNNIDGLTGDGQRSDTTILFHLSADREHAYGVSIPRDSLVTRPDCTGPDGENIPGAEDAMWNEAFAVGGPACTIQQFEQTTDVRINHYVVVDFAGFKDMVDAIDGVPVCIPEDISDPAHGINIEAGSREIRGDEALNYVRARYTLGDGSDIGRVKRQQAFIAGMANKVVSGGVLARPDRLVGFLRAATKSLTVDPGMGNVVKLSKVGLGFQDIGLDNIRFITVPFEYDSREEFRGRIVWTEQAETVWQRIRNDQTISKRLDSGLLTAGNVPGSPRSTPDGGDEDESESPSASESESESGGPESPGASTAPRDESQTAALEAAGLCT
ncbi:LCP family protein [Nocardioides pantholopis]|uniref:LCP family protein n=1 Tax=Nocardioides pantholopis TaxID=2483798 RepID=UPI000FDC9BB5|nr:LCP family protein [Nocardioides pantholopis]